MMFALLLLQPVPAEAPAARPSPVIELNLNATARRVVIERKGEAELTLTTSVNGREGESIVEVDAPRVPEGRRVLNDVDVRVRGEARLPRAETSPPPTEPGRPE